MSKIKSLFVTPKKAVVTSTCLVAALAGISAGTAFAVGAVAENNSIGKTNAEQAAFADTDITPSPESVSRTEFGENNGQMRNTVPQSDNKTDFTAATITAEYAKDIALQHAALTAAEVTFIHAELDYDDGVQVYDVEFYKGNTEYDYEIDAITGSIRSYDYDAENYQQEATQNLIDTNNATYIGVDKAKNIAVSHAGIVLADTAFQKAKLENDDGRTVYEIEFYKNGIEYEYTIDAVSGIVLEYEAEQDD